MKTLRNIITVILAFGAMLTFNESDAIWVNIIGIACLAGIVWISKTQKIYGQDL